MENKTTQFKQDKYFVIKNLITPEVCNLFIQYAKLQSRYDFTYELGNEAQTNFTHSKYGDFFTESLLLNIKPKLEEHIEEKLLPTFSYYRVYKQGDILEPHVDRNSCEVCVSLTFGWQQAPIWPFKLANDKIYFNDTEECKSTDDGITLYLNPGDAVIFNGIEVKHWRDELISSPYYVQAFFHYVRENGPYAALKYDERQDIGAPNINNHYEYVKQSVLMKEIIAYNNFK